MRLSDFPFLTVLRDAAFERTGRLSTPLSGLCVPVRSEGYVSLVGENVAAVITTPELAAAMPADLGVAIADDVDATFCALHTAVAPTLIRHQPTRIDGSARVDPQAHIAAEGVVIGPEVVVEAFASVGAGSRLDRGSVVLSGARIGVQGFNTGVVSGRLGLLPHVGGVLIREHAVIKANAVVDRALFGGATTVGEETTIDNLVNIAHDVQVGRRVHIGPLANLFGRVEVGDEAHIGPSACIINGAVIGPGAHVSMGAVVTRDVPAGQRVTGNFAIPHERFLGNLRASR